MLSTDPLFSTDPTTETYTNDEEDPIIESSLDFNEKEMDSLKNNVNYCRIAMSLNKDQKYMMTCLG